MPTKRALLNFKLGIFSNIDDRREEENFSIEITSSRINENVKVNKHIINRRTNSPPLSAGLNKINNQELIKKNWVRMCKRGT